MRHAAGLQDGLLCSAILERRARSLLSQESTVELSLEELPQGWQMLKTYNVSKVGQVTPLRGVALRPFNVVPWAPQHSSCNMSVLSSLQEVPRFVQALSNGQPCGRRALRRAPSSKATRPLPALPRRRSAPLCRGGLRMGIGCSASAAGGSGLPSSVPSPSPLAVLSRSALRYFGQFLGAVGALALPLSVLVGVVCILANWTLVSC